MPPGGADSRPRQPQLSAAAARAASRPPLTPKIASSKQPSPAVSPLGAARRPQIQHKSSSQETGSSASPLLANITPRTGTRQTRVESANSTPSGTPNADRRTPDAGDDSRTGLGVSNLALEPSSRSNIHSPDQHPDRDDSKFFYASDVPPGSGSQPQQRPPSVAQRPVTFFHANGASADARGTTSPPGGAFTPVLASTPEPTSSKFFYANGTPDYHKPTLAPSGPGSTVSTSSRMAAPRPATGHSATGSGPASRPMSPVKAPAPAPPLQGSAMPAVRPAMASPPTLTPATSANGKRRVSIEEPARDSPPSAARGHGRTGSVPTFEQFTLPANQQQSPHSSLAASPPLSPALSKPAMTMASLLQAADELSEGDSRGEDDPEPGMQSPTKSVHSNDPVSELVANARRERKVQDLEITNASLEAINRTLERQLRKQTAELRRYRRLSRSGRLSTASGVSSRVASAAMTDRSVSLSDLDEGDEAGAGDGQDSLDESDFSSDDCTESDADGDDDGARMDARRKRDEMRLQLDLTKHQELLIDSQKMNHSIKRCLDWTDVLIKEGNKALAYSVRVSDVELGGRVLAPPDEAEEEDDDDEEGDGSVIRHGDDTDRTPDAHPPSPAPADKPPQDRDSGVELPVEA